MVYTGGQKGEILMSEPIQENVERALKRIEPDLYSIVEGAWGDWLKVSGEWRTRFSRTRANLVWDRMICRAFDVFSSDPDIKFIERFNTVSFILDDHILFRFKKGDIKGLSHNYPTQLALAYHNHNIPLFPDVNWSRVEIVYSLDENKTQTTIERICVVARKNDKILWGYDIKPQVVPVEEIPVATQRISTEDLVQVRKGKEDSKIATIEK
jgi:hypothetical protein